MPDERRPIRVLVGRPADSSNRVQRSVPPDVGPPRSRQSPPTDIHETDLAMILEADLPGVGDGDVEVRLEDSVLSLRAQARSTIPGEARRLYEEAGPREFVRSFILGDDVDMGRISAELKDGVLRLTLPRADRGRRRIEIQPR